jgi:hypothetical protein
MEWPAWVLPDGVIEVKLTAASYIGKGNCRPCV